MGRRRAVRLPDVAVTKLEASVISKQAPKPDVALRVRCTIGRTERHDELSAV